MIEKEIATGFKELDKLLGGLRKSEFAIIGGRPSIGKTSLVLSIAKYVVQNEKVPTAFFSFEMSKEQIVSRYLYENQDLDYLIIDDCSDYTISEFKSECIRLNKDKDIGLIVVDYLQLFPQIYGSKNREIEFAGAVNEL